MKAGIEHLKMALIGGILLGLGAGVVSAAPYVILENGKRYEGKTIQRMRTGEVRLIMPDGNQFTFSPDRVKKAVADKPRVFDPAVRALQAEKYDLAIKGLEKVVDEYSGLEWDVKAMPYLARAYAGKEDYPKAVAAFEDMFEKAPSLENNSELLLAYCKALLNAGKMATLEERLDQLISKGSRKAAANAQLMRGNIEMSKNNYKDAAKDYLRTVYFFKDLNSVMPEATYKLAVALDNMRDKRAEKWYRSVANDYPGTEFAKKAKSEL